jgi:uroporphyrin-III C-methyltransferase
MHEINNFDFLVVRIHCMNGLWGQLRLDPQHVPRVGIRSDSLNTGEFLLSRSLKPGKAKVYLVGAGPGDPDLLTVKAVRTLGLADVVLHDALVSAEVLALVSPRAQIVNVGKRCGRKSITQDEINDLMLRFSSSGKVVVRLKSGDPLIFGRAGEELDALREAGVQVEIVPGVTAALAAAATVQASLTDRRKADQLLVISAHRGHGKDNSDWQGLVTSRTTVVVYMPGEYAGVAEDLRRAGLRASTPCAVISKVSSPEEQRYQTTLGLLDRAPLLPSPCVLIVGETLASVSSPKLRSLCLQNTPLRADFEQPSGAA